MIVGYEWVLIAAGPADIYLRSVVVGVAGFLGLSLLPILVKWLLIGRWKPQEFPIWSLRYFRFWLVKTLIRTNPLVRFAGSPLYVLYLRLLGAKIGTGATILSPIVPVCTDMLTIGVGALDPQDLDLQRLPRARRPDPDRPGQYRPRRDRRRGDGARHRQLGGRGCPAWARLEPARRTGRALRPALARVACRAHQRDLPAGTQTRVVAACVRLAYSVVQLLLLLGVVLPLGISSLILLVSLVPQLAALLGEGPPAALTLDLLSGRPGPVDRAVHRRAAVRAVGHDYRAAAVACAGPAEQGLSAVRHQLLGPPDDRAPHQQQVLPAGLRRQLVRGELPAGARLRPGPGRADRVELRHRGCTRQPVPERGRHGNPWSPTG